MADGRQQTTDQPALTLNNNLKMMNAELKKAYNKKMNINLHNYETFFLLYVDNELSAAAKSDVHAFVKQYPYLQQELDQLKDAVLPLDKIIFAQKSLLQKPESIEETLQEKLLLHLDNELADEEKEQLEFLLDTDKRLQIEWTLLQKTTLDAGEKLYFPDKTILYKYEKVRWITGRFIRLAVAATLIGAGFFVGISLFNNQKDRADSITLINNKVPGSKQANTNNNTPPAKDTAVQQLKNEEKIKERLQIAANDFTGPDKIIADKKFSIKDAKNNLQVKQFNFADNKQKLLKKKEQPTTNENILAKETPLLPGNNVTNIVKPVNRDAATIATVNNSKENPVFPLADVNIPPVQNSYGKTASLRFNEENDNHIFMINEENISRSKVAGFLKKIKRTVERTTKIKPGNSLKIAGFEFAVQ